MRIALASIHPRALSGQIEGLVGLAEALEKDGHTVEVVSAFPSRELRGPARQQLSARPPTLLLEEPFRLIKILGDLVRLASRVDVIHLNLPTPAFSLVADLLQRSVCTPVVVGYEAHLVRGEDLLRLDRLRQAPLFYLPRLLINNRLVARLSFHRAARYVVSSHYQRAELVALGVEPGRIRLIPSVLPSDKLAASRTGSLRDTLPPGRLLTYIGHYNHVKGVDVLARAFQQLAPRLPDLRLVLAWSGLGASGQIKRWKTESGFDGRVVELGKVDVPALLRASDVVALPYRLTIGQAAYPATLLEALAANVPIVTSDLPLLRELTQGGRTALLARPEDPTALACAIERALTERRLTEQMLEAQREWLQRSHPQSIARQYERLYEQVAAGQRVPRLAGGCEEAR